MAKPVRGLFLALGLSVVGMAAAAEIDRSPRPVENPRLLAVPVPVPVADVVIPGLRPQRRSGDVATALAVAAGVAMPVTVVTSSVRPRVRPAALARRITELRAAAAVPVPDIAVPVPQADVDIAAVPPLSRREQRRRAREAASMQGAVCGVPAIKGERIAPIQSSVRGCGVAEAVRVTSVSGVRLSQSATVECGVAQALNTWVDQVVQPVFDGRLIELRVAAHYACRSRNNVRGAPISEHGKGRAIDIAAFVLSDGTVLTVSDNFNRTLRRIYKAACGIFRTTLGPGSDGFHEDHFHFDTAQRRGTYCR